MNGVEPPVSSRVDYCWNKLALRVVSGVLRSAGRLFHVRNPLLTDSSPGARDQQSVHNRGVHRLGWGIHGVGRAWKFA